MASLATVPRWRRRLRRPQALTVLTAGSITILAVIIGAPLLFTVFASFRGPLATLPLDDSAVNTLSNFTTIISQGSFGKTISDTAIFTFGSLVVALGFGVPLAWVLERSDVPLRRTLSVLLFAPMLIPPITNAQVWALLLSPETGLLNRLLRVVIPVSSGPINGFSMQGMVIAQGLSYVPIVALFIGAALRNMDNSLEEASRTSGAGLLVTLRHVTSPLLLPSLAGLALLLIVFLIGQFEIPLVFGIGAGVDNFGIRIWKALYPESASPYYGQVAAYSVLMIAVSYTLIIAYARVTSASDKYVTVAGKGQRAGLTRLGRARVPVLTGVVLFVFVTVGLRLFVLVWQSVVPYYRPPSLDFLRESGSLDAYWATFEDPRFWDSVRTTVTVSVASAAIVTVLGAVMAWVTVRNRGAGRSKAALDLFASSSLAIPGPVAAFALFLFYLSLARIVPIYGTMLALILGYSFRLGLSFRMNAAAMTQISRELEDASATSGAGPITTFRRVVLPLLAPTLFITLMLGIVSGVNEFTMPLFLGRQVTPPISVYTFGQLSQAPSRAAATGVIAMVAVLVVAGGARAAFARWRGETKLG